MNNVRLLEHIHGHLGWLAAALVVHPAILLTLTKRRAIYSVLIAFVFVTATAAMGLYLYPEYRAHVKPSLAANAVHLMWLFERKEHLAFAVVSLTWAGTFAYLTSTLGGTSLRQPMRRSAGYAFSCAGALAITTALLGLCVASYSPL